MWSVNVMYLLLLCYACLSTGNGGAYFASKNFFNVLHWDPVEPTSPGQTVFYDVHYLRDDQDQYQMKRECQNITGLSCDLTAETPSKPYVHYKAKVLVNGSCVHITTRFKPLRDTVLGPPLLSTRATTSAFYVNVTLQRGPNGISIADIINSSKVGFSKTATEYILKVTYPGWAAQVIKNTTGHFEVKLKPNQTEYCGNVVYKPHEWGRSDSASASFCVTLPDDPGIRLQWLLVSFAVLSAAVIIPLVCVCNYLKGGKLKSMPQALAAIPGTGKMLQSPEENLIISKILVGPKSKSDQKVYSPILVKTNVSPQRFGGYSPQDVPWHLCSCNTDASMRNAASGNTSHCGDASVQFSETYSSVAVHNQVKDNDGFHQSASDNSVKINYPLYSNEDRSWVEGELTQKLIPSGMPHVSDSEFSINHAAKTLVLNTIRINGQPVSSAFPSEDMTSDTLSQMNPERKPLLSDIIDCQDVSSLTCLQRADSLDWTDSGCDDSTVNTPTSLYYNTTYFASQKASPDLLKESTITSNDILTESSYKQNWVPEIQGNPASSDTWTAVSPKMDEEVEDNEENSGQILLGHWAIQIQQ